MDGLAFLSEPPALIYLSLVLLISSHHIHGDEEDDFIATYGNSETELSWPFAHSSSPDMKKKLCESLQAFRHADEGIVQGVLDHGYLLFKNKAYHSRPIDTIACQTDKPDRLEYFYCSRGRDEDSHYLLTEDHDKMFYLGEHVRVSVPVHRPGEILLKNREELHRQQVGIGQHSRSRTKRKRIEQPIEQKPNNEHLPYVYHPTIWQVDL